MNNSNKRDTLEVKHQQNRNQRLDSIKRWVEFIKTHDVDEWGDQQNRLVDSQLESARQSELDIEHRRQVAKAGREHSRSP